MEAHEILEDIMSTQLARYGLSWTKFRALGQLRLAGDRGLTQTDLSKKMQVSRANITGLIERLEKDGLVARSSHPSDKRAFSICLTKRAEDLMNAYLPVHNDYVHSIISPLSSGEKESLVSLLEKLKSGLEKI